MRQLLVRKCIGSVSKGLPHPGIWTHATSSKPNNHILQFPILVLPTLWEPKVQGGVRVMLVESTKVKTCDDPLFSFFKNMSCLKKGKSDIL